MPVPLPRRAAIIRSLRDNEGRPIELRDWVRRNIIEALDGFKTWPRGKKVCTEHAARVGQIMPRRALCKAAPHPGCDGLKGFKILVVVIDVTRQDGKTTGGASYVLTDLLEGRNCHCLYLAAAEGQSGRVFDQKFLAMLASRPDLQAQLEIGMDSLRNPARNNTFLYVPTSARSIASGSYRLLFGDELRDIDPEVVYRLLPQILSVTGVECPNGHTTQARPKCPTCHEQTEGFECEAHGEIEPPKCPACGVDLEEFFGRALLCSSAGDDSSLHTEMVNRLRENPHPNWHLFSSQDRLNPSKSKETEAALFDVLSELGGGMGMAQRELRNVPGQAGDTFLSAKAIEGITDPGLANVSYYERAAVGFLDCSSTGDLTALVICGNTAPKGKPAWSSIATIRIDVFDPHDREQFPDGRVRYKPDPVDPGNSLQEHLAELMPRFPGIFELWIDTTLLEDAHDLYRWARRQPWGVKVFEYPPDGEREIVKKLMWDSLEARTLAGPRAIRIQKHPRLIKELLAAKTKVSINGVSKVVDSGRGDRRGKQRLHRDVSMSLAGCCWIAGRLLARETANTRGIVDRINEAMSAGSRFKPISAGVSNERY